MKDCEIFSNLKAPCSSRLVVRMDGRNFSNLAYRLELEKPYDRIFVKIMTDACLDFFKEFAPGFIYIFSDEVNVLLDYLPFSGRVEKINSVFASFISSAFTRHLLNSKFCADLQDIKPISFDSRIIPLDNLGLVEYFKGRQNEAWRNCLNGYAYWTLRIKYGKEEAVQILDKREKQGLHELLYQNQIKITEVPSWQRRGIAIYREKIEIEGYNPIKDKKVTSQRFKPYLDCDLPIFSGDFFYSKKIIKE
ncbi:MAG: guanylyltransferase [Methanobacterium sp.]|nr:guanylyltransferase [Methanobacterium sp.]